MKLWKAIVLCCFGPVSECSSWLAGINYKFYGYCTLVECSNPFYYTVRSYFLACFNNELTKFIWPLGACQASHVCLMAVHGCLWLLHLSDLLDHVNSIASASVDIKQPTWKIVWKMSEFVMKSCKNMHFWYGNCRKNSLLLTGNDEALRMSKTSTALQHGTLDRAVPVACWKSQRPWSWIYAIFANYNVHPSSI